MKKILSMWAAAVMAMGAEAPQSPAPDSQNPQSQESAIAEINAAAKTFLASLSPEQKAKAVFAFGDDEREHWRFTPQVRKGLPLEALDEKQHELAKKLLGSVLSERGVLKAETIIQLEQLLGEMEKDPVRRNHKAYFTSIFGEPGDKSTWGYRFEGHHLAINLTIVDGAHIIAAPTFMGASPAQVREGRLKGTRPLEQEEIIARKLAVSLYAKDKSVVYTAQAPGDILTAENRVAQQLDPVGLTAAGFTKEETLWLMEVVAEYAHRYRAAIADEEIQKIKALDPASIRFGWAGSLKEGEAYYYRIQTPQVLIEAANSQNNANHIHTVWRDQKDDFGRDSLGEHYKEDKH